MTDFDKYGLQKRNGIGDFKSDSDRLDEFLTAWDLGSNEEFELALAHLAFAVLADLQYTPEISLEND